MATMKVTLEPKKEAKLRKLAERIGDTPERYAAGVLSAHVGDYDKWFVAAVEKGLKDVAEGRVLSLEQLKQKIETRRARRRSRKRRS
jgi:predicted transcriptional regulator